jgi:two-component system, NarL family, nitrate/nitrite response regulator NarL
MQVSPSPAFKVFVLAAPLMGWCLQGLVQSAFPRYEAAGTSPLLDQALSVLACGSAHAVVVAEEATHRSTLLQICERGPVLLVTNSNDQIHRGATPAGVRAVVPIGASPEAFLSALDRVAQGQPPMSSDVAFRRAESVGSPRGQIVLDPAGGGLLTARELDIVCEIAADPAAQGKLIAQRLGMSEHTLRNHLTSIYSKLCIANRVELYSYAIRHGLGGPEIGGYARSSAPVGARPITPALGHASLRSA